MTVLVYVRTCVDGVFQLSYSRIGPTELRILMAAGAIALISTPTVDVIGLGAMRLWDIGGIVGAIGLAGTFLVTSVQNVRALYVEETRR